MIVLCTGAVTHDQANPSTVMCTDSAFNPKASSSNDTNAAARLDPRCSILRANPLPEVTDLICRLPLPTLFYRLEAVHLGDLMRLLVRTCGRIHHDYLADLYVFQRPCLRLPTSLILRDAFPQNRYTLSRDDLTPGCYSC